MCLLTTLGHAKCFVRNVSDGYSWVHFAEQEVKVKRSLMIYFSFHIQ